MRVPVRRLAVVSFVVLAATALAAQKPKGVPAKATFNSALSIVGGDYHGVLDGAFRADLSRTTEPLCFGEVSFTTDDPALAPEPVTGYTGSGACFEAHEISVHGVATLPLSGYEARQARVSFVDNRGYLYVLQFGDAYLNPPNYSRGACGLLASGLCIQAGVDTAVGEWPGQAGEDRTTGPEARLSVQIGRKKPVNLGIFEVPFYLSITKS